MTELQSGNDKRSVLIVDDEILIRMMVVDALEDAGFRCIEASTAADAMTLIAAQPDIALLISDIGLPGGQDGRSLTREARSLRPGLPIILMTGYSDAAEAGSNFLVVSKPFDVAQLVDTIKAQLADGHHAH